FEQPRGTTIRGGERPGTAHGRIARNGSTANFGGLMNTAAKVGAFFLVVLVIAGLLIWKIEGLRFGKGKARTVSVEFKDLAGLDAKSAVRGAGVRVGKVDRIRVDPQTGRAIVEMSIDPDVDLRQGASAAIANLGLLGEKYVELTPGPVGAP